MTCSALSRTFSRLLGAAILGVAALSASAATPTFDVTCNGCHITPAEGARINAAGAAAVVNKANTNHGMSLSAGQIAQIPTIVAEFDTHFFGGTSRFEPATPVVYHTTNNSITMTKLVIDVIAPPNPVITSTSISSSPTAPNTATGATPNSLVVKYSHFANNCNADSFQVVGTGGATTAPRIVPVTITHPPAPSATGTTTPVVYSTSASAAQPLSVAGGPTASIVINSQPSVGSVAASGIGFTYTGSATQYSPSVTFTWHALGPCGEVSSVVTQTVSVGLPPAPATGNKTQTVQANATTNVNLTANVTGIFTPPITITVPPANGNAVVFGGTTVNYTPNTNYSGPDSFSYTATGPGGTSNPAGVVNITVTTAPLTANKTVTTAFQTPIPIDLTSSITGAFLSVAVASPASHGAAVATGPSTITYTPSAGYSGPDSFTYTATGAGGTSTAATVNITVKPPAPTAGPATTTVPSGSTTSINLSGSITGVFTSINVVTPTSHGVLVVSGASTVDYTPTPGYFGTDSFTYTATGPGGTSPAPGTVTITVTAPPPPLSSNVTLTVPYNTPGQIDLAPSLAGVFTSVSINNPPTHGTATTSGTIVTYTPNPGYIGPDSLTYAALGIGGTSPISTILVTVKPPGPPTVTARTVTTAFNTAVAIDLTSAVTGIFTSIAITTQPQHGTVTLAGNVATYKPANGYTGADSFAFTATGPGGTSSPANVAITVNTAPPVASSAAINVNLDGAGTIDLAAFISGSGITGISIGTQPAHGTTTVNGTKVTYTPNHGFFGKDTFTYIAYGDAGTSPPATVTITVIGRPDPTKDPLVPGIIDAQNSTAQRFGRAQISNIQSRLESLHQRAPSAENVATAPAPRAPEAPQASREEPIRVAATGAATGLVGAVPPATTNALASALANSLMSLAGSQSMSVAAATGTEGPRIGGLEFWVAGTLRFGNVDAGGPMRFTTDGVSAGVDKRVAPNLTMGMGVGYARDKTDIGTDGSKTRTKGTSIAAYSSFNPGANTYLDTLIGYASLDMDTDRFVGMMDEFAKSSRKGDQWFGSASLGYEYRRESLILSPYGRLDYASTRLKQATESGGGAGALTYFEQTVPMFQGVLGLRAESQHDTRFGAVRPRARIEYSHDFEGDRTADVAYADLFGTRYTVTPFGTKRNAMLLGIGSDFLLGGGLKVGIDYQTRRASRDDVDQGIRLQFTQALDGKGSPWMQWFAPYSSPFADPVRVDASYTYDDNVTRARDPRDVLADNIFTFGAAKSRIFPTGTNTRVVAAVFANGEELYRYSKLARGSGGVQAEFQYRPSGDWDAPTFGLQGRVTGDYYDSELRRGVRYTLAITARQSLTDRIEAFAALTGNQRDAKNAVFDTKDYGGKFNLDYSLGGPHGSLYLAGEFRRGDVVSSGRYALVSLDTADVFTADDAFGPGYFAYRFDAKTWLGTFGYNRPLGPRDAIDFSYRRAESTPTKGVTIPSSGPSKYIDNQYSIIYLMRF